MIPNIMQCFWPACGLRKSKIRHQMQTGAILLSAILVLLTSLGFTTAEDDVSTTTEAAAAPRNVTAKGNKTEKNCFVVPKLGTCKGLLYRYFFHWGEGRCYRYTYSGCGGTGNNFRSRQKCMRTCWPQNYYLYCRREFSQGDSLCKAWVVRYYYDESKNHCFPFYYTGCGGNLNNFRSEQECRAVCIQD